MENLECPQCGNALANGVAVCGACGKEVQNKEVKDNESALPPQEKGPGRKNLYAILAVLLVVLGGAALLIFTGLLPNPLKGGGSTAAIVNGEKITTAEVDQKFDLYRKMSGKSGQPDSTPEAKAAAAGLRMQILNALIQEKILVTEAAKEKITVPPQEVADRIAAIKKSMNLSDTDFEVFLKNHGMAQTNFDKRIEKDLRISKLVAKGTQEKGLTRDAWLAELFKRAKVEILAK